MFFVVLLVDECDLTKSPHTQCLDFVKVVSVHSGPSKANVVALFLGQQLPHLRLSLVVQAGLNGNKYFSMVVLIGNPESL